MKKSWIIVVCIAIVLGISLPFILNRETLADTEAPIDFGFSESFYSLKGDGELTFSCVNGAKMERVELLLNGKKIKQWNSPKKNKFSVSFSGYSLGTYQLLVKGYKGGEEFTDNRYMYINASEAPSLLSYAIKKSHPHNSSNFTQGYEFYKGGLYESTGNPDFNSATKIAEINAGSGSSIRERSVDNPVFGEGITILNDKLYQISWQDGLCFVYDVNTFAPIDTLQYSGEGWGLCNDGTHLIMSNGTSSLTFRDPESFEVVKTIEVHTDLGPLTNINELDYTNGRIWANIWISEQRMQMDSRMNLTKAVCIDAASGAVVSYIDIMDLFVRSNRKNVPNGIAYNKTTNTFWFTGKYWDNAFELEIKSK